jgi:hypothetical protein
VADIHSYKIHKLATDNCQGCSVSPNDSLRILCKTKQSKNLRLDSGGKLQPLKTSLHTRVDSWVHKIGRRLTGAAFSVVFYSSLHQAACIVLSAICCTYLH